MKSVQLLALLFVVVALAFICSQVWDVAYYWRLGRYKAPLTIPHLIMGFLVAGYFPVLPWVAFPVAGYVAGRHLFIAPSSVRTRKRALLMGIWAAATGALANVVSYVGQIHNPAWKALLAFSFYPLSPSFFLFLAGILVTAFTLTHSAFDVEQLKAPSLNFLRLFSRYSLTLYLFHFAFLIGTQRLAGWLLRRDTDAFLRHSLNPLTAIILGIIAVPLLYKFCSWWDKHGGRYSFEWWLSKLIA